MSSASELILIFGLMALVILAAAVIFRSGRRDGEADTWAGRHGLELTPVSRPWVETYLRTGRNLRQVCALGGIVVPATVHAATGLDLHVSGLVWLLVGYLVGCLWSELALTRAPAGTRRAASLVTRRLSDYLPRRMRVTQVVLPTLAVALGVLATAAYRWNRSAQFRDLSADRANGIVRTVPNATDQLLHSGARVAAVLAPIIMVVAWLAERYIIRRPQPVVDPSLVAADDALRSSSVHLLGASGMAAVCLLIASQCGYFLTLEHSPLQWIAGPGTVLGFVGAFVIFRYWRNAPWQVRRGPTFDDGPDAGPGGRPGDGSGPGTDSPRPSGPIASATTGTLTIAPADDAGDGPDSAWSVRRSPIPLAVGVIVVVALAGWGLRTWGGINPAVTLWANSSGTSSVTHTRWTIQVGIQNEARAPIELLDVRSTPMPGQVLALPTPDITGVGFSPSYPDYSPSNVAPTSIDLPKTVPGGTRATLTVELRAPVCNVDASLGPFDLILTYRTQSGRIVERTMPTIGMQQLGVCLDPLPTGPQPADPVAADDAVRAVATVVYDPNAGAARLDAIDDPRGLAEADAQVRAGQYADVAATTTATIGDISFDRPDHAWFYYELSGIMSARTGQAVLVDGRWKVTRATVCADIALAGVTCPPLR